MHSPVGTPRTADIDEGELTRLRTELLAHFDAHARDLPWREAADPYAIWISEVMLQQTRVAAATPYYLRWMERFPTVESLAGADLDEVLEIWAGLGYYSRARNLHRAAGQVCRDHGGRIPTTVAELRTLPGVGDYTAGAVASIAFDRVTPAVDGNVRRVLSRLFDLDAAGSATVRQCASELVDPSRPGDFNQALMELGATVCTPRSPRCEACPLAFYCRALTNGTVALRPGTRRAPSVRTVELASFVAVDAERRSLLIRRPDHGLLAGMWEFPSHEVTAPPDRALESVTHAFTHLRATYHPIVVSGEASFDAVRSAGWVGASESRDTRVHPLTELNDLAVPTGQKKIAARVVDALSLDSV